MVLQKGLLAHVYVPDRTAEGVVGALRKVFEAP